MTQPYLLTYGIGQLAYIDTLACGLVPCKVIAITESGMGAFIAHGKITVRVTAKRPGYKLGEIIADNPANHIVPRKHVYRLSGTLRIRTNYLWESNQNDNENN